MAKNFEVNGPVVLVIVDHLETLASDLKEKHFNLKLIDFPTWIMQPVLVDLSVSIQNQDELPQMQKGESVKILFNIE